MISEKQLRVEYYRVHPGCIHVAADVGCCLYFVCNSHLGSIVGGIESLGAQDISWETNNCLWEACSWADTACASTDWSISFPVTTGAPGLFWSSRVRLFSGFLWHLQDYMWRCGNLYDSICPCLWSFVNVASFLLFPSCTSIFPRI